MHHQKRKLGGSIAQHIAELNDNGQQQIGNVIRLQLVLLSQLCDFISQLH